MPWKKRTTRLLSRAATLLAATAGGALAQDAEGSTETPQTAEEIVVLGEISYRNRSDQIAPVLQYGLDYFQRFEPLTVGDMLKRTPSTAFVSDVLEFDGVRLRGLDSAYTQILVNGERMPGSGVDRSFFVDRIPAELVERIEIVRSSSADRSGDAVAGALNIVLRDSYSFDGGFIRAGGLHFKDDELKPVVGGVFSGPFLGGRVIVGANVQGRHNPKEKVSYRYEPDGLGALEFTNREDQSDVRDGTDYSGNGEMSWDVGNGELKLNGFYVRTDRTETENSREFESLTSTADADLTVLTPQFEDILQETISGQVKFTQSWLGGKSTAKLGYAALDEEITTTEEETEFAPFPTVDDFGGTREFSNLDDTELTATLKHEFDFEPVKLTIGLDYTDKDRDADLRDAEIGTPGDPYPAPSPIDGGIYSITEERIDPFVKLTSQFGIAEFEAGLRYETTDVTIEDFVALTNNSNSYDFALPSAHILLNLTANDRIRLSYAHSVRRPDFDLLAPVEFEEEPTEDNDLLGNPDLDPELARGFDIGYERRLGITGVAGINFFYRKIEDLIELTSTGIVSSSGDGFDLQPQNIGDGEVWGIELDFSSPMTFIGLDDTGVFLNYSLLDSSVTDPVTGDDRRFNNQAKSVFNVGFIQNLPALAAAFGATYREQGDAFARVLGETVTTAYGGDLEAFVEKRFGESFTLRFTASNLLDLSKDETFNKWETRDDQLSGDINNLDEFEIESEKSGPVFQLVGRVAF